MAKTQSFRDALVADLATVAGLRVYTLPVMQDTAETPCAIVSFDELGEGEPAQITNRQGERRQRYAVRLVVKTTDSDSILDLFDNATNAIEKTGSAISGVAGFIMADVVDWTRLMVEAGNSQDYGVIEMVAEIRYFYQRGSL